MIIELIRDSSRAVDDAHELNRLICKNTQNFSTEFVNDWHQAYQAYCKDREAIRLIEAI